ncbi:apoptosis-inducing factor [Perkinsus chesapeaki]|uniref:Calmodulin n=1 Tax=Perkinsus chesapeaki TaxID=330153 RepID=A0A7J6LB16_PERCH|nr:apoptosis-inducing factor [Perkinsus chesapeaki]
MSSESLNLGGGLLTDEQIDEFKEAFDMFDKDGEGTIGPDEFTSMMKTLGLELTEKEVLLLLQEVDEDKSGEIEFEEMLSALVRNMRETTIEEQMEEAYRTFDRDDKGYIDSKDLSRVVCELCFENTTLRKGEELKISIYCWITAQLINFNPGFGLDMWVKA